MTEEEATTKWCPFARVANRLLNEDGVVVGITTANRSTENAMLEDDANVECMGSHCMAWRTTRVAEAHQGGGSVRSDGYCGLAGKP